jgi:hypothetical protein
MGIVALSPGVKPQMREAAHSSGIIAEVKKYELTYIPSSTSLHGVVFN